MLRIVVMNADKMQSSMDCNFGGIPKLEKQAKIDSFWKDENSNGALDQKY